MNIDEIMSIVDNWFGTFSLPRDWDKIQGGGWGWIADKDEAGVDIPNSEKYRFDFEFAPDTSVEDMLKVVSSGLRERIPSLPNYPNFELAKAFLYAGHTHKPSDERIREQKMDEITVFLRFKRV